MPDVPSADAVAALRAANARLRQVAEAKDTEIEVLRTSHQAQLDVLRAQVAALPAEVAELRARLGRNPRNSPRPPSSEGLGRWRAVRAAAVIITAGPVHSRTVAVYAHSRVIRRGRLANVDHYASRGTSG